MARRDDTFRSRYTLEWLELRRLLAADLHVEVDGPVEFVPGQQSEYTVRVTNHGPDDAESVKIAMLESELEAVRWERDTKFKSDSDLADLAGHDGLSLLPDRRHQGFGREVTGIGDVNGDGIDDVLVADTRVDSPRPREAWVIFGAVATRESIRVGDLDGSLGFRLSNIPWGATSLAGGGDINGDGVDDFLVASSLANREPFTETGKGETYVVLGRSGFPANVDVQALDGSNGFVIRGYSTPDPEGIRWGGRFGHSVDIAGDFNDDGLDDMVIGGIDDAYVGSTRDRLKSQQVLLFGSPNILALDASFEGLDTAHGLPAPAPRSVGDFNGDHFPDLLLDEVVLFTPTETVATSGSGDLDQILDVAPQTRVTWTIRGTLRDDFDGEAARSIISVFASELRSDRDLANNSVELLVPPTVAGDVDGNRIVDFADFLIVAEHFGQQVASRSLGDLNRDGTVGFADFLLVSANFDS